ncbi:hypothetical protein [Bizionia sp.]|uniref:hypothetical protein n=1 Tax=Bizionia sp. TaxID=1954480 RepID=UPI003A94ED05
MKPIVFWSIIFFNVSMSSQEKLPYYEIPKASETFTAGTVAARAIDGLGFRFYWATEGLREDDLNFRPNDDARSSLETIDHIYDLSRMIANCALKKENAKKDTDKPEDFEGLRKATLLNLQLASNIFKETKDISEFKLIFEKYEVEFWTLIHGPIEDAVWHCGQIALLRRSSGNPFNSKVSVFSGRLQD